MGNILTGLDLIRRSNEAGAAPCFGLCFPLLTRTDGTKMGKSAEGAVWLAPGTRFGSLLFYNFCQFWHCLGVTMIFVPTPATTIL